MKRFVLFLASFLFVNQAHALPNAIRAVVASSSVGADATLVNWWKLNEGTGTSITDYGSAPKTGTMAADATWSTSGGKNVVAFVNGVNGKITFSSTSYGTTHTVSMCVNFTDVSLTGLDNVLLGGAFNNYAWYQNTAANSYYADGTNFVGPVTSSLSSSTWVRLSVVRTGTTVKFYQDNSQIGTDQTLASNDTPAFSTIGNYADGSLGGNKMMSAVRVYTRALSSGDISALPSCPE